MFEFILISKAFLAGQIPGAIVGFVAGAFTPSIGRKIKSYFVKESAVAKGVVAGVGAKAAAAVSNAAQDVAKKL